MSPRNITLRLIEEAQTLPDLAVIDYSGPESRMFPGHVIGEAHWGNSRGSQRYIRVPEFGWTDHDVATWLHEIGHMRTIPRGKQLRQKDVLGYEVLAWRWAQATLGDAWTPELSRIARKSLNSYRADQRLRRMLYR